MPLALIPVVYAAGMAAETVAALAAGFGYDRIRGKVLYVLPPLVAAGAASSYRYAAL